MKIKEGIEICNLFEVLKERLHKSYIKGYSLTLLKLWSYVKCNFVTFDLQLFPENKKNQELGKHD
jgi:hypothetical protein